MQETIFINRGGRRLDYIDTAKGLGMLTIIWGHICLGGISNSIVYSFHIPLFFFLSGLVFSPKRYNSFKVFLTKRLKGLLFPYVVYSVITWIVWALYSYVTNASVESYWMPLFQTLIAQGSEGYLVHNVPLWFVMCLFSVEVLYYFIAKLKKWANAITCLFLCALGVLSTKATFFDFSTLPWSFDVALMALPFYAAGSWLSQQVSHQVIVNSIRNNFWLSIIVVFISSIVVFFGAKYNVHVSMGHASLGRSPLVFYGTAVFGVLGFMILCVWISLPQTSFFQPIKWIGRNSFRVMAIHNPVKGIVIVILAKFLHISSTAISYSEQISLIAFIVTLVVTLAMVMFIEWSLKTFLRRNTLLK